MDLTIYKEYNPRFVNLTQFMSIILSLQDEHTQLSLLVVKCPEQSTLPTPQRSPNVLRLSVLPSRSWSGILYIIMCS